MYKHCWAWRLTLARGPDTAPATGFIVPPITGTAVPHAPRCRVTAGDVVIATDGHPFWVPDLGQWIDAVDLAPGMWLQTSAGTWVQVSAVQAWTQAATVHNLTVQGVHTFHVTAGGLDVLNHNCGGGTTVYRGVSEKSGQTGMDNPAFDDAVNGVANPRGGSASPESHHLGNTNSDYTSWTTSSRVALTAATKDGGAGAVLRSTIPSGRFHVHSNDQPWIEFRGEHEVIIQGRMYGEVSPAWSGMSPDDLMFL
ncbi:hypothetical protein CQJ94_09945 [Glycomyces fuscus]|nr:hypothetical protein CQJ94_09945 [Glycomyces fuscus]